MLTRQSTWSNTQICRTPSLPKSYLNLRQKHYSIELRGDPSFQNQSHILPQKQIRLEGINFDSQTFLATKQVFTVVCLFAVPVSRKAQVTALHALHLRPANPNEKVRSGCCMLISYIYYEYCDTDVLG